MLARTLLAGAAAFLAAAPAFAQSTLTITPRPSLQADPRFQAETGFAAARNRAAMAQSQSRQTQTRTQNLALDRQAEAQAGQRSAARADLQRRSTEDAQAEQAEGLRRDTETLERLRRLDPTLAPN